jgi:Carbohydrate esterase, sialic acid-specific acetylesterase
MSRLSIRYPLAILLGFVVLARPATGQFGGMGGMGGQAQTSINSINLKSPVPHQVFQRDANNLAQIPIILPDSFEGAKILSATVSGQSEVPIVDGKLVGLSPGSYTIQGQLKKNNIVSAFVVGPVLVGDLWVLAGQSNMEGYADLIDVTPPNPLVSALGMDGQWVRAEEPLHWLVDSPDPVHSQDPATRAERSAKAHKSRPKGAGLGLPFAIEMVSATNVPIGLVPCAHGGTSMEQWSPAKKDEAGKSLYGSMLRQVRLAGGKVKGVLWYQGESDANPKASEVYAKTFSDFIAAVRGDLAQPELPFYYVQIGRYVADKDPKPWNTVQEIQRKLPDEVANTAVISVIDLELDDAIHVGTVGLKRAGQRLARIALREQFGQVGGSTPTLDRVTKGAKNTLVVKFKGVNRVTLNPAFGGMSGMGGMGGMGGGMRGGMGGMGMMSISPMPEQGAGGSAQPEQGGGLQPERHIAGFSIRAADGKEIPLIFEAMVGPSRDTVILKLAGPPPAGAALWYGWGLDPYCNLTDTLDMAVPTFGPIALDVVK